MMYTLLCFLYTLARALYCSDTPSYERWLDFAPFAMLSVSSTAYLQRHCLHWALFINVSMSFDLECIAGIRLACGYDTLDDTSFTYPASSLACFLFFFFFPFPFLADMIRPCWLILLSFISLCLVWCECLFGTFIEERCPGLLWFEGGVCVRGLQDQNDDVFGMFIAVFG